MEDSAVTSQNCDTFAIVPTTPDPADAPAAGVETGGPVTDSPGTCTCGATLRQFHRGLGPHSRPVTEPACPIAPDCTDPDHFVPTHYPDDEPEFDAHTLRALGINR